MVFSSTLFLFAFLPFTLVGYYLINPKFRNIFLTFMSLFFYAWGEPKFVFLMIGSILVNYVFGLLVDRYRENKAVARVVLTSMITSNVVFFFIFKYLNFTIANLNSFFGLGLPQTHIVLPIGISFFTFHLMSYVFDVYRQKGGVQKNPLNVALYVSSFPQLVAGPIVRYETVAKEINHRHENMQDFSEGVCRFIIGLAKKVIISNNVAIVADHAFGYKNFSELPVSMAWLGIICYTLQIYFDFGGYSDMAIGLGRMFGFYFLENFEYPYISRSITEFWRRWHISLGTWFRDYVYFPLGGSRVKSKYRLVFNLFVVWMLTGIWHGASWNFLVWGMLYFVLLVIEKLTGFPEKCPKQWVRNLYWVPTMLFVMLGWVLFRSSNLSYALNYMGSMFGLMGNPVNSAKALFLWKDLASILVIAVVASTPVALYWRKVESQYLVLNRMNLIAKPIFYIIIFVMSLSYVSISSYNPFIYFNF
ncbi:MBOAT family O-acyltransferase [Lacrimispora celerecrescens]|uniref:MBOAT family O-acyltransferase n=1 Tax=Lacrimispora celerecrescens TaxID=29354 RepID=UPI001644DAFF|nr:MBOAT family protein [Lacrimispora celerecrescens]